jgi:hypothetical protein
MRRDIGPIPIGKLGKIESAVVMAAAMVSVQEFGRTKAKDLDRFESVRLGL